MNDPGNDDTVPSRTRVPLAVRRELHTLRDRLDSLLEGMGDDEPSARSWEQIADEVESISRATRETARRCRTAAREANKELR